MSESGRALIAGIGQPWMCDLAFGSHAIQYLKRHGVPPDVDLLDLSFSPIASSELIQEGHYERIIFVTARGCERPKGVVYEVNPADRIANRPDVHAHIGDAVMGCVSLETLLIVCRFRGLLPGNATILEIEPEAEMWGPDLSPAAESLLRPATDLALSRARAFPRL